MQYHVRRLRLVAEEGRFVRVASFATREMAEDYVRSHVAADVACWRVERPDGALYTPAL